MSRVCSESSLSASHSPRNAEPLAILIPAYRPGQVLIDIVKALSKDEANSLVVVDDGSGGEFAPIFAELRALPGVEVVPHAVNLGKGSALKTGINHILCAHPEIGGIVTVDADGQHDPADVLIVCEQARRNPDALILGVRVFDGSVPLRSKLGNRVTRQVMRAVLGHQLSDSQTGLRAIPRELLPALLKVAATGYEFELEMLVAVKHLGLRVIEEPIRTIYEAGNATSHFRPLRDSMRIYLVLLRFTLMSLLTAAIDNLVFYNLFHATGNVLVSQIGARVAAVLFNYTAVKKAVFLSDQSNTVLLPRYLTVVFVHAALSYSGIRTLTAGLSLAVMPAKILTETCLFIVNFFVQRDFVFMKKQDRRINRSSDRVLRGTGTSY